MIRRADVTRFGSPGDPELPAPDAKTEQNPTSVKKRDRIERLINDYSDFAARSLRLFGLSDSDTDDGLQEVYMVLARRLNDIRPESEKAFVYRVAQHTAFRMNASRHRRRENVTDDPPQRELSPSPEVILGQQEALGLMRDVIQALPEICREVFVLFEVEELSSVEIAKMLGIPRGTVVSRLRRAREMVEARMRVRGYARGVKL